MEKSWIWSIFDLPHTERKAEMGKKLVIFSDPAGVKRNVPLTIMAVAARSIIRVVMTGEYK